MMGEAKISVSIADDRESVAIEIGPVGAESQPVELSLDQLTKLIAILGRVRHRMVEGKPMPKLEGLEIDTVIDTNWYIKPTLSDDSLMAFYHPGFGPMGFVIPRDQVAAIVKLLSGHLTIPTPSSAKAN